MITDHLDVMYTVVWSFAIASVVGSLVCFFLAKPLARLSYVPFQYLAPALLVIMFAAAYSESTQFGGLIAMLVLGVVGFAMKVADFPRAPLLIGFILSVPLERYYFLTSNLYSTGEWIRRPLVIAMLVILAIPLVMVAVRAIRARGADRADVTSGVPQSDEPVGAELALAGAGAGAGAGVGARTGGEPGSTAAVDVRPAGGATAVAEHAGGPEDTDASGEGGLAKSIWPLIFSVVTLAVFVTAYVAAQGYPSRARLAPGLVTLLGAALTAVLVVREGVAVWRGQRRQRAWNRELRQTVAAFGWLVLFVALVNFLGFVVGALVFVPLFLLVVPRLGLVRTGAYTAIAVALLVVAYLYGNIDLPAGTVLPLLPGFQV